MNFDASNSYEMITLLPGLQDLILFWNRNGFAPHTKWWKNIAMSVNTILIIYRKSIYLNAFNSERGDINYLVGQQNKE